MRERIMTKFEIECKVCDNLFTITTCDKKRNRQNCSSECARISGRKQHSFINGIECRECSLCGNYMSLDMFYKGKCFDGFSSQCKICKNKIAIERGYSKNNYNYVPVELVERACEWCGNLFTPKRSSAQKYCDKLCISKAWRKENKEKLKEKKKVYYETVLRPRDNIAIVGSEEHKAKISGETRYNYVKSLINECPNCEIEFESKPSENRKYCCASCYHEHAIEDNHHSWKENRDEIIRRDGKEFTYTQKIFIKERDEMICQLCGVLTEENGNINGVSCHIDHIIPIAKNGTNDTMNGRVLCKSCNQNKSDMLDEEFIKFNSIVKQ